MVKVEVATDSMDKLHRYYGSEQASKDHRLLVSALADMFGRDLLRPEEKDEQTDGLAVPADQPNDESGNDNT